MLYEIILDGCSSKTTNDCNRLLMENGLDPLVKEYKKNSVQIRTLF